MKHVTMQPNRHIASSRTSGKVTTVRLPTNREMRWRQIHSVRTSAKPIRSSLEDEVTNSTMDRTTTRSLEMAGGAAAVLVPLVFVSIISMLPMHSEAGEKNTTLGKTPVGETEQLKPNMEVSSSRGIKMCGNMTLHPAAIKEIGRSKNPAQKLQEIKAALAEIKKNTTEWSHPESKLSKEENDYMLAGKDYVVACKALQREEVGKMFVRYTKEFVEISRIARINTGQTFNAFGGAIRRGSRIAGSNIRGARIRELFEKYTQAVMGIIRASDVHCSYALWSLNSETNYNRFKEDPGKFVRIANAAKRGTASVFEGPENMGAIDANEDLALDVIRAAGANAGYALMAFEGSKGAELFAKHASAITLIANAAGKKAGYALSVFDNPEVIELFNKHKDAFVEIARHAGVSTGHAFSIMTGPEVIKQFDANPGIFVKMAKDNGVKTDLAFMVYLGW